MATNSNTRPVPPSKLPSPPQRQGYGADPTHAYGLMTPRFWHGMMPGNFWRMAARNRFNLSLHGWATAASITGVGLGHVVGGVAQHLLAGRRIAEAQLDQAPLFVLGHWRSGTTLLHELLMRDAGNTCPNTYQCFAPHHFLVTESWLTPLVGWLLPKKRPMDNVAAGWDRPQEDEFALASLGEPSPYLTWAFPHHGPAHREWLTLDGVAEADRQRWIKSLRRFVAAVSLRRAGRVVLKSPPHTARVRTILEAFPDARFVHITRDPLVLFPSTVRLWKSLCDVQGLQSSRPSYDWIEEEVLSNLVTMYDALERDRALVPAGRWVEMRYEDLVADPLTRMRDVYQRLDLGGDFTAVERGIEEQLGQKSDYRTNRYTLPDEVRERVAERWRGYAERYGYV
ncbi:MAG: sulfotransferase family protein [Lacipirellulaceae bacterium]